MASLRHHIANYVSVSFTAFKLLAIKIFYPSNITYKYIERFSPSVVINIDKKSKIFFGNKVRIHSRCRISAVEGGCLTIADRCGFNTGCIITCRNKIKIGEGTTVGPNVMMFDHDHIIKDKIEIKNSGFKLGEISIGSNTWIGAGVIILAGTQIGSNCVIAAGSVVKDKVPDNTIFIQKRECFMKDVNEFNV